MIPRPFFDKINYCFTALVAHEYWCFENQGIATLHRKGGKMSLMYEKLDYRKTPMCLTSIFFLNTFLLILMAISFVWRFKCSRVLILLIHLVYKPRFS